MIDQNLSEMHLLLEKAHDARKNHQADDLALHANALLSLQDGEKEQTDWDDATRKDWYCLRTEALLCLAVAASLQGDHAQSMHHAENAAENAEKHDCRQVLSDAWYYIGKAHHEKSSLEDALRFYLKSRALSEELQDVLSIARTENNLGNIYLHNGDAEAMTACYERALRIYEAAYDQDGTARVLANFGNAITRLGEHTKALEYYERALKIRTESNASLEMAVIYSFMGNTYSSLGSHALALEYFGRAIPILESYGRRKEQAGALVNTGIVYTSIGDYSKALEAYNEALDILDEIGDQIFRANAVANIGIIYAGLENTEKALESYHEALRTFQEHGITSAVATVTGNIGMVYSHNEDYDLALRYYLQALDIHEKLGRKSDIARTVGGLATLYTSLRQFDLSLEFYERAIALYRSIGEKIGICTSTGNLGSLYMNEEFPGYDLARSEELFLEAIAIATEVGAQQLLFPFYKGLAAVYERQHRWEALEYYKKYHEIEKEVINENAKEQSHKREQQRQIAEREKSMALEREHALATTNILHKVLPQTVAARLVKGESHIADYFAAVSILFADIVGFTPIAARMPARAVLSFLNQVFGEFDRIIERNGCEKIKTIGDGYMAVAGAPVECADHAERIARSALEMMNDIILPDDIRATLPRGSQFSIRIGIHTGPCFGGIVGENRFVYDIYSDAVNIAARMESHGEPGRIHCSNEFAHHLRNRDEHFVFEEREEMEIKGKGIMRTYFLESTH